MVLELLLVLGFAIVLILFAASRFVRLYEIEERHRNGLPIADLLEPSRLWKTLAWGALSVAAALGWGSLITLALGYGMASRAWLIAVISVWIALLIAGWLADRRSER